MRFLKCVLQRVPRRYPALFSGEVCADSSSPKGAVKNPVLVC